MKTSATVGFQVGEEEYCLGVWKPIFKELPYIVEVLKDTRRYQMTDKQNADLTINNRLSILSDLFMQQNWQSIRYVVWNGVKWAVTSVDVSYPRLLLDLGGVYNENEG